MEEVEGQRHGDHEGQHVADCLGQLDAGEAKQQGQEPDQRDKQKAASQGREEAGPSGQAHALEHHIGADAQRQEEAGHALIPQCREGDGHHLRVRLEYGDQRPGKYNAGHRADSQQDLAGQPRKPEAFANPGVDLRAVVKGGHRLIALAHAQAHREDKAGNAVDNAHGGHGGVAIDTGLVIEQQSGQAGQALADQRGEAGGHNEPDFLPLPRHLGELQLALGPPGQEHIE